VRIVCGVGFAQQRIALEIRLQHHIDQAFRSVGASCARLPMRQRGGIVMVPLSVGSSPRIALNSVDLPVPLRRPGRPVRRA